MKRFFTLLTAAVLAAALCGQALAAGSAEVVRTFVYENMLYTYVALSGADQPITKAEAKLGNQTFPQQAGDRPAGRVPGDLPAAGGQFQLHAPLPGGGGRLRGGAGSDQR